MDSDAQQQLHVVAIPYPGRGHINPMLNLCRLLAGRGILVTVVVTNEWLHILSSSFGHEGNGNSIRLRSIPDVLPSESVRGADLAGFVDAVLTKMGAPVADVVENLHPFVDAIVADAFLPWVFSISKDNGIPASALFTQSPTMLHAIELLSGDQGSEDQYVDYLPRVLVSADASVVKGVSGFSKTISWCKTSSCLLFTSFYELECHAIDVLRSKLSVPVLSLGNCIPPASLQDKSSSNTNEDKAMRWLDCQPRSSVLYVSLGSFLSVSSQQIDELVKGLIASGVAVLWAVRVEPVQLESLQGSSRERLFVSNWCDQLRVLCHPCIGGFLTHCGFNSTIEGVFAGVPMLTFPIAWDQYSNSKLIVDDWKVGFRLKDGREHEALVPSDVVAKMVNKLMDMETEDSKEIRGRAIELKAKCRRSLEPTGSSSTNFDELVRVILQNPKGEVKMDP